MNNKMRITFLSISQNEAFARSVIASFMLSLNPTLSQINEVKTAVSEAVTNAIVHGYPNNIGEIVMEAEILDGVLHIEIKDVGVGIVNVSEAIEPFYSTKLDDERSGMGFTVMKSFMDEVNVFSKINEGTVVKMKKLIDQNAT